MSALRAGLSYLRSMKIASQVVRESLKEPVRSQVMNREKTTHAITYWVNGKQLPKGRRTPEDFNNAVASLKL